MTLSMHTREAFRKRELLRVFTFNLLRHRVSGCDVKENYEARHQENLRKFLCMTLFLMSYNFS